MVKGENCHTSPCIFCVMPYFLQNNNSDLRSQEASVSHEGKTEITDVYIYLYKLSFHLFSGKAN